MSNKVFLLGRLVRDAEVKQLNSGKVANFTVVTEDSYKDKITGEKKKMSEFHNCVAWNGLAGILETYGKKSKQVYIEGKLETTSYEKNGEKVYKTQVNVKEIKLTGDAPNHTKSEANGNTLDNGVEQAQKVFGKSKVEFAQDEIPF